MDMLYFYMSALSSGEERDRLSYLYEKFKKRLFHAALKITRNQAMAEDAVHNAFVSAIGQKEKFLSMGEVDFFKWSVVIVRGKCIDLLRKEKRYAEKPIDDYAEAMPSGEAPIDERVALLDTYGRLRSHMAGLDAVNRQILEMKYVLQMSMNEIGDELGLAPAQVNGRIARARAKMKELMGNEAIGYA